MPKGGIWLGLKSKDLLNLQLKTELYAGLWVEVESFKQYCIENFWRRTYRGASLQVCKGLMMVRFDKHPSIDEEHDFVPGPAYVDKYFVQSHILYSHNRVWI